MISMTWPQFLRGEATVDGFPVRLTRRETDVLSALLAAYPRAVNAAQICETIWDHVDDEPADSEGSVTVFVSKLRKKIGPRCFFREWQLGWRVIQDCNDLPRFHALTPDPHHRIMPAVETTTEQETDYNGQGQEGSRLQDEAEQVAGHEEHLRLQERVRRRTDPIALYRQVGLRRRCAGVDHGYCGRGLTRLQRRMLQRRVERLLRLYPHRRARS